MYICIEIDQRVAHIYEQATVYHVRIVLQIAR